MLTEQTQRFIFDQTDVRGELVRLESSYQQALDGHSYQPVVTKLLGEFIAASVLLSSTIKFEGLLSLQLRGVGPISLMMAECSSQQKVRAIAHAESGVEGKSFSELFAGGTLAITIEPSDGQRYQGIVPLNGECLADCLEHYFFQSEQLSTRLWLAAENGRCAGLLLQQMPEQESDSAEQNEAMWSHITQLADTVKEGEMLELKAEELLYRLYHQEEVRLFDAKSVEFHCSCSKERTERALTTLDRSEIESILTEKGEIVMDCQFCKTDYRFTANEIRLLFAGTPSSGQH